MTELAEGLPGPGGGSGWGPRPPESGALRRLTRNRSFRRLWLSQFASGVGDWLVIGFLMPLVEGLSGGSSFAVAGLMIAKIIPALFMSSLVGALVDRFDRRRLMIACDISRAVLALALLVANDLASIYAIVLAMEVASLFFVPAKNALIPSLVDAEDVEAANGLSYTTQQASMLVGLTASGAILAAFEAVVRAVLNARLPLVDQLVGPFAPELLSPRAGMVMVDSLTFVLSATMITLMGTPRSERRVGGKLDLALLGKDVREALSFLGGHRELRAFLATIGLAILGGGAIIPVGFVHVGQNLTGSVPFIDRLPVIERLAAAPKTFVMVFLAAGMVTGALFAPRLASRVRLQLMFVGGVAAFALSMFAFASVSAYWVACAFVFAAGFAVAVVSVAGNSYIVRTVADAIRGRVFTALESVVRVALLVSMVVFPPLGDVTAALVRRVVETRGILPTEVTFTGSRITLQLAALVVVAAAAYGYRTLDWRGRRDRERDDPEVGMDHV